MKLSKFLLCLFILCTLSLAKSARAQANSASVVMGPFTNYGDLDRRYYLSYNGSYPDQDNTAVVATPNPAGRHRSRSGPTYAELKNNTSSAISYSTSAALELRATADCLDPGSASASIGLGVTAAVSTSGYAQDIKSQTFIVSYLAPGDRVFLDGTFSASADSSP